MCAVQKPKAYIDRPEEAGKLRALLTGPATGFFYFCTGPPGGGKTTLIQRVSNEVSPHGNAEIMLALCCLLKANALDVQSPSPPAKHMTSAISIMAAARPPTSQYCVPGSACCETPSACRQHVLACSSPECVSPSL